MPDHQQPIPFLQPPKITHGERRETRKRIADEIRSGETLESLAQKYGRSLASIRSAGIEFGAIEVDRKPDIDIADSNRYKAISLLAAGHTQSDVASRLGISRQRVHAIKEEAERIGAFVPPATKPKKTTKKKPEMSQRERARFRREESRKIHDDIEKFMRDTPDAGMASRKFKRSINLVYRICRERGVPLTRTYRKSDIPAETTVKILAELGNGVSVGGVAKKHGVPSKVVAKIAAAVKS